MRYSSQRNHTPSSLGTSKNKRKAMGHGVGMRRDEEEDKVERV
jgi:hypothetical protein